ncbi:3-phosphoshikimate 1-carboxyvinyltransferase [Oligella urethralis]|uniref:3-phosphoshikimate 1-carboxyvinyltransferase n=1 Tax=Oligella urethralis TaxID=90245 RepID=UPI00242C7021|nr:3-phosphoshikimate 1-carboxyvinyltransferase [Oligella urethralis]
MVQSVAYLDLAPVKKAAGEIHLPGSKSISNRVLLLAALAKGSTTVHGLLDSYDTTVMLEALKKLGLRIEDLGNHSVKVHGVAEFPVKNADLFMQNAGTAIRPLTAALAVSGGSYHLHGIPRMHERPIGDLVEALQGIGANIEYLQNPGYPPLQIESPTLKANTVIKVAGTVSSQFLTALLMAAPIMAKKLNQAIEIEVVGELISKPYIGITLNLMQRFGVKVENQNWQRYIIAADAVYQSPGEIWVEGDASSASYFLALGLLGAGPIRIYGINQQSIQGDILFADFVAKIGAELRYGADYVEVSAHQGDGFPRVKAFDEDFNLIPDAAMTAAVLALYADGPCVLRNIASWRVKETDRIEAMHAELAKMGATVESGPDYLKITPPQHWQDAAIETYDDHRMAMCFSLAIFADAKVRIMDPACVNKTFPTYFQEYKRLLK